MSAEATRTLRFRVIFDDAQATAGAKAFHDQERARVKATAREQERADQAYVRAVKTKLKAENDLAAEIKRQAREREQEQARSDAAYVRATKTKLKAEAQLEAEKLKGVREAQAEQDRADADYIRAVKAKLRAEKQLEDEKERAARKAERDQQRADRAYVRAVKMKLAAEQELERERERAAAANGVALGKFTAGVASVTGVAAALAAHFDAIRQDASRAAEDVMKMRGAVRELQALRGELGKTGAGVGHVMGLAAQTLQTPEQAMATEQAGLGIGELALKNDADRKEFEKAMVAAGRFQSMEGGDAGAYGQMMGQIALTSKGPMNAEDMESRAWRLYQIQQPGGFRTMSQAMGQYSQLSGLVQNGIYTPEEAMGLASAFSVASPESAATRTEQFTRAVMSGRVRSRGMKVADGIDVEKTDQYFRELGIGENDSAMLRGRKIAADLAARKKAKGKDFNAYEYLMTRGFANQEDREAIMSLSGLVNNDRFTKIEEAMNARLERGAISRRFEDWKKRDNFAKGREVELGGETARMKRGAEEEPLVLAQKAAFNRLYAQKKITGTFEEWQNTGAVQAASQDLFFGGYHGQVTRETMRTLEAERKRLGLKAPGVWESGSAHEYELRYARMVQSAGGDVTGDAARDLREAARDLREVVRDIRADRGAPALNNRMPMPGPGLRQ